MQASRSITELHASLVARGVLGPEPRFLQFEFDITSKCNLRCRMCYFSFDDVFFAKPVYLAPEHLDALRPWFPLAHTITLSLGNEPLSSPHFVDILKTIAPYQVPNVTFYTNGVLLSPRTIDAILTSGVTQVCVSCDGATRETFEYIRRGARFDRFLGNMLALNDARRNRGTRRPALRMNVVVMRRNLHELVALAELAVSLEMADINFCHVVSYDGLEMESESLSTMPEAWNEVRQQVVDRCVALHLPIAAIPPPFDVTPAPIDEGVADGDLPRPYCLYPFFHVSMNAGGHVLACPFAHGEAPYGTVGPETTLEQVWMNEQFTTLRNRILAHDPPDMCRRCSYLANRYPNAPARFATRVWARGQS